MRKWFTKAHWIDLASAARRRIMLRFFRKELEAEYKRRHDEWELVGRVEFPLDPVPGIEILSLSIWSEGQVRCREHCWHPVEKSPRHHDPENVAGKHHDYVCCRCTNTLCMTCSDIAAVVRPPTPRPHVKIRR